MKRFILILLVLLIPSGVWGAACGAGPFYVSTSGNDANNGTTISTPWAHHPWDANKSGAANCTLAADNIVYMKKGEVWWDCAMTAAQSGSAGHQIVTTSLLTFGTGALPVCSGSYDTTGFDSGWTDNTGNVWQRAATTQPNIVVYNGTILTKDSDTTPAANKWFWESNVLYVNVGGSPASTTAWKVGKRNYPALIQADYVTFKDMEFSTANSTVASAVYIDTQTSVILDGLTIKYFGVNGIYADTPVSCEVKNCTLSDAKANDGTVGGVRMLYVKSSNASSYYNNTIIGGNVGFATTTGATGTNLLYSNTIYNQLVAGTVAYGFSITAGTDWRIYSNTVYNIGDSNQSSIKAINIGTDSNYIYDNTIYNSRLHGITIGNADLNRVYGNTIYNCGYKNVAGDDFLYYGAGSGGSGISIDGSSENNKVYRNYVYSNAAGISNSTTSGAGGNSFAYNLLANNIINDLGDYTDANPTNPILFYNNTIYHNPSASNSPTYTGHGIYVQDVSGGGGKAIIANNLVYNAVNNDGSHGIFVSEGGALNSVRLDNNLVYAPNGGVIARILGTSYTEAAAWKAAVQSVSAKILGLDGTQATAESHSVNSDPLFVSATDFTLKSGSPAINAGVFVPGVHDQAGVTDMAGQGIYGMPALDIGAYGTVKPTFKMQGGTIQ